MILLINPGVVLLVILAIILAVGITAVLIWAGVEEANKSHNGGNTGPAILPSCTQRTNISSLIQIPDSGSNCIQNGITGSLYYIGNLPGSQYDYVVAPWGTQPFDVCIGFCTGFTGNTCMGPNYNGQSAQDNFIHCMNQLSNTGCSPPTPIAAKGTILYYAFVPTRNVCDKPRLELPSILENFSTNDTEAVDMT